MNVLYCITKSTEGGAQTHVMQLCRALKKRGDTVAVVSQSGGWLEKEIRTLSGGWFANPYFENSYNPVRMLRSVLCIRRAIKKCKPDFVSCHSGVAGVAGRSAAFLTGTPVIFTVHGWSFAPGAPFFRRIIAGIVEYKLSWITKKIICVSDFDRHLASRFFFGTRHKLVTIHNGVEVGEFRRSKHDGVVITYVGRNSRQKNPDILLYVFNMLPEAVQNKAQLKFIGCHLKTDNPRVFSYPLLSRPEVFTHLEESDIFVLTSHWEGFPRSILEAMSVGLPVIASDVGGVSEIVDKEVGVLLDKTNEENNLREALVDFIEHKDKREQCGDRARVRIERYFSLETMITKTTEVYRWVVGKGI